jgi:putative hydrolase of the HAD superfamily
MDARDAGFDPGGFCSPRSEARTPWDGDRDSGEEMVGMRGLVLVDFDDTLVETAPSFQEAREALFQRLETEGFSRDAALRVHHREVEPELLVLFGMGPFRMEPSFRDTYLRLCRDYGRSPDHGVAEECAALGRNFMGHPRVMPGSLEALATLVAFTPTVLYSQASHPVYQMARMREAGVTRIIRQDRIRITSGKTLETFLETLSHFGVDDPATSTMIGNSLRSDINPALTAGARAILVEPYEMWHYDDVPPVSQDFLRFPTFPDAVKHLLENGGQPGRGGG